jgi:hypothetical protein
VDGFEDADGNGDFFDQPLHEQINLKHLLVHLADLISWDRLGTAMRASFVSHRGRPASSPRVTAGLLYSQHACQTKTWPANDPKTRIGKCSLRLKHNRRSAFI